jgi:hypothetical protein
MIFDESAWNSEMGTANYLFAEELEVCSVAPIQNVATDLNLKALPISRNRKILIKKSQRSDLAMLFITAMYFFFSIAHLAYADSGGTDLTEVCPVLLSQADAFSRECLSNAFTYERYFDGSPETHYEYIGPSVPGSHFGLGCTLKSKHEIAFLGIYYTIDGDNFRFSKNAMPGYVDFDGNIGLLLNGKPINFLVVRPFQTETIPLPYYASGIKNCEKQISPDGKIDDIQGGGFYVQESKRNGALWIRGCYTKTACADDEQYVQIVGGQNHSIVRTSLAFEYYIEDGGGLLYNIATIKKYCPAFKVPIRPNSLLPYPAVSFLREVCLIENSR